MRWIIFPKCYVKRNISADDDFLSYLHWIININVRFSFNCPFGPIIFQRNYQLLLRHSLFLYTEWKSFKFFFCIFTRNRPTTTQELKQRRSFIRVVSFHRCSPQRNFYLHLTFTCSNQSPQTNIRTKREGSEAYSESWQTFNVKLFAKILNSFQLLFTLFNF